jgi:hypothetical protein
MSEAAEIPVKPASQSTTLQFNAVMGIVAVVLPLLETMMPAFAAALPGWGYAVLAGVIAAGNGFLRTRTSQPITQAAAARLAGTLK